MTSPLSIVLEMTRVAEPDDPHAFRFEPQGYTLRGPTGAIERFDVPWSQELLADLEALRRPERDQAVNQRVGDVMQRALRSIGWSGLGESIRVASEAGREVVVTVRANAAELYALPWELLTVGASGQHLGELPGVVLRHEWPGTKTIAEKPSPRPEGGRVLFAWSAVGGGVAVIEHKEAIAASCSEGHVGFDVVDNVSASRLAEALDRAKDAGTPYAVLHILCHGGRAGSTFGLVVDGEAGSNGVLDGGRLRQLLVPHAKHLRLVVLAACDSANVGDPGNHLGSVAQALHRAGIESVVASRYPLPLDGSIELAKTLYRALLVDLQPVGRAFVKVRASPAKLTGLQLYGREADGDELRPVVFCPYRGLRAFELEHRRFFFGREREREEALGELQALIDGGRPRFLVVYGASGAGKSSVVLAGVAPDIARVKAKRAGPWDVRTMKPGADPLAALDKLIADAPPPPADAPPQAGPRLLVIDQFEEVFTHVDSPRTRTDFARRLWSLAGEDSGAHVIITLRVDFLGRCGELILDDAGLGLDRVAYDEAHRVAVARMGPEQVREVLECPAARVGLRFAPGLLDRLLVDVGAEPGALPLLQYALGRLWAQREGQVLPAEVYSKMGGLVGALEKDANEFVRKLDPAELREARRILVRLVDAREDEALDTRRRVELAQLQPAGADREAVFDRAVALLVEARLVVRSEDERHKTRTLEVAHEALIRRWEVLRVWIAEDREMLAELERLRMWAKHKVPLTGSRLDLALDFLLKHGDDVDPEVRMFVEASEDERRQREAEREAQRRRRRRNVIAVISSLSAMLMVSVGFGIWALGAEADAQAAARKAATSEEDAKRAAKTALDEADRATTAAKQAINAQRIAGARLALLSKDPNAADLIAFEVEPDSRREWSQMVVEAAHRPAPRSILRGHEDGVDSASLSPDGHSVLTVSRGGTARVWRADGSGQPVVLQHNVNSASFSTDGRSIVTASKDGTARVWQADGSGQSAVLPHEDPVASASFSPDDRSVLTVSGDTVHVWQADGSGQPVVFREHEEEVLSASFSPDGHSVVSASVDRTARVWRADGSGQTVVLRHKDVVMSASFSPDGSRVVTVSDQDASARVWSADGSGRPVELVHDERVVSASFSPDGRKVVTVSIEATSAWVWDADRSGEPQAISGHEDAVVSASFSPDGRGILTTSYDGTARVWRADAIDRNLVTVLRGHDTGHILASFSADSRSVLTASEDGTARVWRADGTDRLVKIEHATEVRWVSWSPDSRSIVAISDDAPRVWRVDGTGEPVVPRLPDDASYGASSFSPDGRSIATVDTIDGTVFVWRADGSGEPVILPGRRSALSASFSPDSRSIVTTSWDGTAHVWRADGSGDAVVLDGHAEPVLSASFSPDGRSVVTSSKDGTARVWRADGSGESIVLDPGGGGAHRR